MRPIEHVKFLCAEIGPRGPTTDAEAQAAAYVAAKLKEFGARQVSVETFRSVPSLWWALEIALAIALASTGIYYFAGGRSWGFSILMCIVTLYITLAELSFWKLSLSNFLPKRTSQNVYARVPPKKETRRKLVVIGHLDTNITPIFFHPKLVRYLPALFIFVCACVSLKIVVFLLLAALGYHLSLLTTLFILDVPIVAAVAAMLHGDLFCPFTEGANDNATGASVVLSLAELFSRDPLEETEYWALCTGCEEATLTGIRAFLENHGHELRDACFVDLECVGIGDLRYVTYEGMLKKYYSSPGLLRIAADAARAMGDDSIEAMPLKSGYTETAVVLSRGLAGITIMALPEHHDEVPHWHRVSDRIENIEPKTLDKALRFLVTFARELDS